MLSALGWADPEPELIDNLKNNKKLVVLFPHTSEWDMIITLAYFSENKELMDQNYKVKTMVKKAICDNFLLQGYIQKLNPIPAEKGSLGSIFEELDALDEFVLFMSPKGKLAADNWKTGWYKIAKRYDARILTAGLDFSAKRIRCGGKAYKIKGRSMEEMEKILRPEFNDIIALHPECEYQTLEKGREEVGLFAPEKRDFNMLIILAAVVSLTILMN